MASDQWIARVADAALSQFDAVTDWLGLAGGKNQGREYLPRNPKRNDGKPGSFSINRDTGHWQDFATGDRGGDLVALAAYLRDVKQGEAGRQLAAFLGIAIAEPQQRAAASEREAGKGVAAPAPAPSPRQAPAPADSAVFVSPVPDDAPPPPAAHARHGKPAARWAYTDAAGRVCFYHDRFEPAGERKQFAPLTLWRRPDGRLSWQFKAPPAPRVLLGLPDLAAKAAPAVLVEGEKARDAAALLLPAHPVLTWQGGAQAVSKTDFTPLAGIEVWLWPDNDEAGEKAAADLVAALAAVGAGPVKRFNLALLAQQPGEAEGVATLTAGGELGAGDDAADLAARGWQATHLALLLTNPDALQAVAVQTSALSGKGEPAAASSPDAAPEKPSRRFELQERGVYFFEPDKSPRWICAPLAVTALVRDPQNSGWGLLTEFADPDRKPHQVIVPMQAFRGDGAEVAGLLLDHGLKIAPSGKPRLIEYLQTAETKKRARVTTRTGWHPDGPEGASYVLPGQAFGPNDGAWIFQSDGGASTFAERGTLASWQSEVAALCSGNSRLVFAVSMAFAAPLLYIAGSESGGFHLRSNSSDGKTTALRVAASVCGGPEFMQRWRATDNGLEGLASQHCDAPLLLDELAQIDPRAAGEVAYMLANGSGKARAGRTGGVRERATWRVLFLSAGEIGLTEHMGEAGKTPRAGQELRLAELPADAGAGMGVFEDLHGYKGGGEFAKALDRAARQHHGVAFVAYLGKLAKMQQDVADVVREAQRFFEAHCLSDDAHGQARRVAGRFALVGAGGELATKLGITGWAAGEAMKAARTCFEAWLSRRGGEGNQEERAMLQQVREFLRRHGEGVFTDWNRPANDTDKHAPRITDRAGYRRNDLEADVTEFFIFAEPFRTRVCKGFDAAAVGRLLLARGYIARGTEKGREWQTKIVIPTEGRSRVIHVLPAIWEDDDD